MQRKLGAGGVYNLKSIDRVHIKFLKKILRVNPQTHNFAVYSELGRDPTSLLALEKSIKYSKEIKSIRMPFIQTYLMKIAMFSWEIELVLIGLQKLNFGQSWIFIYLDKKYHRQF